MSLACRLLGVAGACAALASGLPPLARAGVALLVLALAWHRADAWRAKPPVSLGWSADADAWWLDRPGRPREACAPPRAFERWPLLQLELGRAGRRRPLLFVLPELAAADRRALRLALARAPRGDGGAGAPGAGGIPGGLAG